MSYTPPDWDAADFTWEGEAAYTAPDWDAADFSFAATGKDVWLQGVGILGQPRLLVAQSFAQLQGVGILGSPQILAEWPPNEVYLQGIGILGTPSIQAREAFKALMEGAGLLGSPTLRATIPVFARLRGVGLLGVPRGTSEVYPASAGSLPAGIVTYHCKLTGDADGLSDLALPISSFSVRHKEGDYTSYQIAVPGVAMGEGIAARTHGQIVISQRVAGEEEELLRGDLGDVRLDQGTGSATISISGNSTRPEPTAATYPADGLSYRYSTFTGENRMRIAPRAAIRPGDYVRYQGVQYPVTSVTWSVAVSAGGMSVTMEVAN